LKLLNFQKVQKLFYRLMLMSVHPITAPSAERIERLPNILSAALPLIILHIGYQEENLPYKELGSSGIFPLKVEAFFCICKNVQNFPQLFRQINRSAG